jgi:hypothetical protein
MKAQGSTTQRAAGSCSCPRAGVPKKKSTAMRMRVGIPRFGKDTRHNRTNRINCSYILANIRWSKSLAYELTAAMSTLSAAPQVSSAVSPLQSSVSDKPCVCDQQAQYCFRVDGAQRNCVERVECCTLAGIAFAPYSSFMKSRANPLVSRPGIAA